VDTELRNEEEDNRLKLDVDRGEVGYGCRRTSSSAVAVREHEAAR
jgi:hypothetical protein